MNIVILRNSCLVTSLFFISIQANADTDGFVYSKNSDGSEDKSKITDYVGKKKSVIIPNHVIIIDKEAFASKALTSITIPNSVTEIRCLAFYQNELTDVIIPNSVTEIRYGAFYKNNLSAVTIPNYVIEIGDYAFDNVVKKTTQFNKIIKLQLK